MVTYNTLALQTYYYGEPMVSLLLNNAHRILLEEILWMLLC